MKTPKEHTKVNHLGFFAPLLANKKNDFELIGSLVEQVEYEKFRSQLLEFVNEMIDKKNRLIAVQDNEPTLQRHNALNRLESDIELHLNCIQSTDLIIKRYQILVQQAYEFANQAYHKTQVYEQLLQLEIESYQQLSILFNRMTDSCKYYKCIADQIAVDLPRTNAKPDESIN